MIAVTQLRGGNLQSRRAGRNRIDLLDLHGFHEAFPLGRFVTTTPAPPRPPFPPLIAPLLVNFVIVPAFDTARAACASRTAEAGAASALDDTSVGQRL